jgi:hypothetical protein
LAFRIENCGDGVTAAFPNYHNNLALAVLVPGQAAITAMCFDIGGLDVAAKVPAIYLGLFTFPGMASRSLYRRTNADLYDRPMSRLIAKALLPFTSLQNMAMCGGDPLGLMARLSLPHSSERLTEPAG